MIVRSFNLLSESNWISPAFWGLKIYTVWLKIKKVPKRKQTCVDYNMTIRTTMGKRLNFKNDFWEFLLWLSGLQTRLVSMRMQVQFLAWLSGLRIRHCHELWCRSQTRLRSVVAVAVAQAGNCSSDSTPSLGTSVSVGVALKKNFFNYFFQIGLNDYACSAGFIVLMLIIHRLIG